MKIIERANQIERAAVELLAVLGPWFGPIPSAYLVGRACMNYLHWHWLIAWIAAAAVESIGVVSVVLALRLYDWNETRTKLDPAAPFTLSVFLVGTYFIVTIGLTVLLDVIPGLARYAPAIFPLLAAVGAVNIAIKNGQQRREAARLERKHKPERSDPAPRPERQLTRQDGGNFPAGKISDWRTLPEVERGRIGAMDTAAIQSTYGVSERTARNWRKSARQLSANGKVEHANP